MKTTKKNLAIFAVCALACSLAPVKAEAASAVKLSEKSATLLIQAKNGKIIYGTTKIKVKKAKKIKVKKVTYKSQNKKVASVSKKGSVKAVGKGTTKISVTVKYKMGKKTSTKKLAYKVEVINLLGNIQGGDDQNTSNNQNGSSDKNTGNDKNDTSDKDISSKDDEIPETAIELDGHYYLLYDEGYNWQEAKNKCEDLGGHLVTITSLDEQKLIEKLLEAGSRNSYWIGGYKKDGDWKWITDEEFSFSNWSFGEPNNITYTSPTGEDSLMVYRNLNPLAPSSLGGWNDLYNDGTCGKEKFFGLSNLGFICEWESGSANNQ